MRAFFDMEADVAEERLARCEVGVGRVGLHVVHVFEGVPHQTDSRAAQVVQNFCDVAPLCDFPVGAFVAVALADDYVGYGFPRGIAMSVNSGTAQMSSLQS